MQSLVSDPSSVSLTCQCLISTGVFPHIMVLITLMYWADMISVHFSPVVKLDYAKINRSLFQAQVLVDS